MAEKNNILILRLNNNLKNAIFEATSSSGNSTSNYVRNIIEDNQRKIILKYILNIIKDIFFICYHSKFDRVSHSMRFFGVLIKSTKKIREVVWNPNVKTFCLCSRK